MAAPLVRPHERTSSTTRLAGWLCLAAGLTGVASGVLLSLWPPAVDPEMYSYPFGSDGFTLVQVWFGVHHLGLVAGVLALRPWMATRSARVGHLLAVGGLALLTLTELLAISARNRAYGDGTLLVDSLYGISTTAAGVGLLLAGVAVRRAGVWPGWRSWVVLALGAWVFVPMTPAIMAGFLAARLSITGWMALFAALGLALLRPRP